MGIVTTTVARRDGAPVDKAGAALVWIDAREAVIVRIGEDGPRIERLRSDVPAHRRSTGHIRHDPSTRHGGGREATAGEPRRLAHLEAFCKRVAARIRPSEDVVVMGPGMVRHDLEDRLREAAAPQAKRRIDRLPAGRMTDRQLIAWLRRYLEEEARRSTVGAYRWTGAPKLEASGHPVFEPHRTFEKPTHEVEDGRD